MKNLFKELIADFHHQAFTPLFRRNIELPPLPAHLRKAWVFIGMRRSGKTSSLYQIMQNLIAEGKPKSHILYLNFEDERLADMETEHFQDILKAYFELYPEYMDREDIYFFFDEIHEVLGWEKFIRRLLDGEKMQIFISGSSCKMLSSEIASTLRGRSLVKEIFPYNFREYSEALGFTWPTLFGSKQKITLAHHQKNFLQWGGFPETVGTTPEVHRTLLQDYMASVIYRDIVERYTISNPHALRLLLLHLLRNSASLFSISKMYKTLKSQGFEIGKDTLYDYLTYFEDAFSIFSIQKFDLSLKKASQSMKKVYAVDQGLITAFTLASQFDLGKQLETALFSQLRRSSKEISWFQTENKKEVDFLTIHPDQSMHLFQATLSLKEEKTRTREVGALESAMQELGLSQGTIVTLDEEEEIEVHEGTISCIPFWKLFLSQN